MALLRWELKKIWRPGLLLAIALIGAIFYQVRTGFYLEHFNTGDSWGAAKVQLAYGWLETYGNTIEPEERSQLDAQLAELKEEFAQQAAQIPGAAEAGITDYESYVAWVETYNNSAWSDEANALDWAIYDNTNLVMLGSLAEFMEAYEFLNGGGSVLDWGGDIGEDSPAHQASVRRIREAEAEGVYGFLPSMVKDSTDGFFHYFAIWCVFSGVLLISPTLVRDALRRTRAMQWTSRRGRRILNSQMWAALLSGLLLTLLNFAVYLGPFLATGALKFRDCSMVSVWWDSYPWFDWTYSQYLLALLGLTLVLALAACGFTVVLSQFSSSYVAMLLKAIPLIAVLCWGLVPWTIAGAGLFSNRIVRLTGLPGTEFVCGVLSILTALALCGWTCLRQRHRELKG